MGMTLPRKSGERRRSGLWTWVARAIVLTALFFIVLVWNFNAPPVDLAALSRVTVGMSQADVRRILGSPSSVFENGATWAYSRLLGWSIAYVYFDEQGAVARTDYDR
jgi:hypothetical protein